MGCALAGDKWHPSLRGDVPIRINRHIYDYDHVLILGPRFKSQDGTGSLLGREGEDVLDARNGRRDTVTTGSGGKGNVVRADRIDKVIWGWGLAGF